MSERQESEIRKSSPLSWKKYGLIVILIVLVVFSVSVGAVKISAVAWQGIWHAPSTWTGETYVLWQIRVPRSVFAVCVGAALGLAGALTQALFRNPLADPGLIGVSSGAMSAALLGIVLGLPSWVPDSWQGWVMPMLTFFGALICCLSLERLSAWLTPDSVMGLLLLGIALNALAGAWVGLALYVATDDQLRQFSFWTLGSLSQANWFNVGEMLCVLMLAMLRFRAHQAHMLNALVLGDRSALHMGVPVQAFRRRVMFWVALLAGAAVAWTGIIGFVGLIAPHLARMIWSADQRHVLPASMGIGAVLLLLADILARTVAIPAEVPVGIFTALMGAPFFILVLKTQARKVG